MDYSKWVFLFVSSVFCVINDTLSLDSHFSTSGKLFNSIRYGITLVGVDTKTLSTHAVGGCLLLCLRDESCRSVSYNSASKECHLNKFSMDNIAVATVKANEAGVYIEVKNEDPWTMIFRATSGIGQNALDAFLNAGHSDDDTFLTSSTIGCITVDGRLPCDRHFRFKHLDDISQFTEVKYAFFTNGIEVAHVTFAARTDTDWEDIFRFKRIINSTYRGLLDLSGPFIPGFGILDGYQPCGRHFYMPQLHSGCSMDAGWLFVSDSPMNLTINKCCSYDGTQAPKPQFLYSTTGMASAFSSENMAYADTFVISVKF